MLSTSRKCVQLIGLPTLNRLGGQCCLATVHKPIHENVNTPKPPASPKLKSVPAGVLSHYLDTNPPTATELKRAERFFTSHPPKLLFVAGKFYQVKQSSVPEVAFLGRSNVGKSSLLNCLMGKQVCYTSKHPGRTQTMNGFAIGGPDGVGNEGRLTVLDMPGYGHGSHEEWGKEIMKYLVGRKELRRAFLLVDPLHGLKQTDEQILKLFRHNAIPHQVILSKVDRVLLPKFTKKNVTEADFEKNVVKLRSIIGQILEKIQPKGDGPPALGEVLACSGDTSRWKALSSKTSGKFGIDAIRWAVLAASGLHQKTIDVKVQMSPAFMSESEKLQTSSNKIERRNIVA